MTYDLYSDLHKLSRWPALDHSIYSLLRIMYLVGCVCVIETVRIHIYSICSAVFIYFSEAEKLGFLHRALDE